MGEDSKVSVAMGLDVGDKWSVFHVMTMDTGEEVEQGRVRTLRKALGQRFEGVEPMRVALEVGTHSPWIERLLKKLGHEVVVANASKVALIHRNSRKNDRVDAERLARLARVDPKLLHPIRHRSQQAQQDLALVRSRDQVVGIRTQLISHVRGAVKAMGHRLPSCSAESFARRAGEEIPRGLKPALDPILEQIATLTRTIRGYDKHIERLAQQYAPTQLLRQIPGVGSLTSLTYVLVLEDPTRFANSRTVGAYLGFVPRMDESGQSRPSLRITKEGDALLRRLLVQSAHYILGPFGQDCDLRRYGERIHRGQTGAAKKRATVAVARKLAVLLHHLWVTGEVYDPFHTARKKGEAPEEEEEAA